EPARADGGFGLIAMRQRIEGLAGRLLVESEPGGGTGISACVPAVPVEANA
ncbi:MAG TPA: sensor histidine kinase, partial [Pseudonocardiaceae bacterium]|nr:sensor histidine kinase [Pseudonocardiaceae bacterium]